jgi:hypothetical protein
VQTQEAKAGLIQEASVNSPLAHAKFLHEGGKGHFTLGQKTKLPPPADFLQHSSSLKGMVDLLPTYSDEEDVYITPNRFKGSRSEDRLIQLSALYSDVDYYKIPELSALNAHQVLGIAMQALDQAEFPKPSLAVATGRGLALVWRHESVPPAALNKWKYCQDRIFDALLHLGADSNARDAARVLRLVGTRNSKTGTIVETLLENDEVWDFSDLADRILPLTTAELEEQRPSGSTQRVQKESTTASKGRRGEHKGLTLTTLYQARMRDLHRLIELRGYDQLPPGKRDEWMFCAAVALSYLEKPEFLEKKSIELGREKAGWNERETRSCIQTVVRLAKTAAAGETVEWEGKQRDPRYRLTNNEIIKRLKITPTEQASLETIISEDIKKQRDKERKRQKRRKDGAVPRDEYLAAKREGRQHKRTQAKRLLEEGAGATEIGRKLGLSRSQVYRLISPSL